MRAIEFLTESTHIASNQQVWDYVDGIHPKDQQSGGFLKRLIMRHPQYELKRIPLSSINIPDQEYDDEEQQEPYDPYGRAMFVDPDHAGEYSMHHIDTRPIVIDTRGNILDGTHRAWAASELMNKKDIMAYVPVLQLKEGQSVKQEIKDFIYSLAPDDVGVEEFPGYRIHFEGFTDECKSSSDYQKNPDKVYQQVYQDFIEREGGKKPVKSSMVGDEEYPILYSVFKVPQSKTIDTAEKAYSIAYKKKQPWPRGSREEKLIRSNWQLSSLYDQYILKQGVTEGSEEINWIKPNFDYEWDEIEFQAKQPQVPADVRNYMSKHFPNKQAWMKSVQHGRPVVVSPDHGQKIRNYTDNKQDLLNALSPQSHDPQGPAKAKRVNALFDKGGPIEMPIILQTEKGLWLIGGKTRLGTANLLKGIPAKVWMIGGEQGVTEGKDFDRCFDQACKLYDRAVSKNLEPKLVQVADFQGDGNGADPRWMKLPQHVWQHYVVIVGDQVLDPTAKQFGDSMPTQYKVSDLNRLWGKQYQIRPRQGVAEGFPQPGESSGKAKQFNPNATVQTKEMTLDQILGTVKGIPYVNNVVDDWDAKDYSWGVTKKVIEYAQYLQKNPQSVANLPPLVVIDGQLNDGAHRLSAINLLQKRMDPKNPLWKQVKLKVNFGTSSDVATKQGVTEAFDQPYAIQWTKQNGDWHATADLDDGSELIVLFMSQGDNSWMVEFERDENMEITGEGDAQRVFATVLTAMRQFIDKRKPAKLNFSAEKDDDPTGSRAKLYDRMIQRYIGDTGYTITRNDYSDAITYTLTRIKPQQQLTELGDSPSEYKPNSKRKRSLFHSTVDNHWVDVFFDRSEFNDTLHITFSIDGNYDKPRLPIHASKSIVKIMSTVLNIIKRELPEYMRKARPPSLSFTAKEDNRASLYRKYFVPTIQGILGPKWELSEYQSMGSHVFNWKPMKKQSNESH